MQKGQIKPKADWHTVDSPNKGKNEFGLFKLFFAFYGKQNKFIRSLFWENLLRAQTAFGFI